MKLATLLCVGLLFLASRIVPAQEANNGVRAAKSSAEQPADTRNERTPAPDPTALRLGPGDLLNISVYGVPDLTQDVRISSGGEISLALIGTVHVGDLTPDQARDLIETRLRDGGFIRNPYVSVLVKEFATQGISVMGEVTKPGIYPLLGSRRLYDAISAAGGLTPKAGQIVTIARRNDPQHPTTINFGGDPAVSAGSNVPVYAGDTIVMSKAGLVYVVGDVEMPGGFVMDNNEKISVLQAVALARGAKHTAAMDRAKIIRKRPDGTLQEIPIPLDKILAAKSPDVPLVNDDIVFVPGSAAKSAARKTLDSIVQVATGVAIYRR